MTQHDGSDGDNPKITDPFVRTVAKALSHVEALPGILERYPDVEDLLEEAAQFASRRSHVDSPPKHASPTQFNTAPSRLRLPDHGSFSSGWDAKAAWLTDLLSDHDPGLSRHDLAAFIYGMSSTNKIFVRLGAANADAAVDSGDAFMVSAPSFSVLRTGPAPAADRAPEAHDRPMSILSAITVENAIVGAIKVVARTGSPPLAATHKHLVREFGRRLAADLVDQQRNWRLRDSLIAMTERDKTSRESILEHLAAHVASLVRARPADVRIYLRTSRSGEFVLAAPVDAGCCHGTILDLSSTRPAAECARANRPALLADRPWSSGDDRTAAVGSSLAAAIPTYREHGQIRGVIEITSGAAGAFSHFDLDSVSILASQVGRMLDHNEEILLRQAIFDTVINTSQSPVIIIDKKGYITEINKAAQDVLGAPNASSPPAPVSVLDAVWNTNTALARHANWGMVAAARRREPLRGHYTTFYRRGPLSGEAIPVPVRLAATPLRDPNTTDLIGSIGIFEDLCLGRWCPDVQRLGSPEREAITIDVALGRVFDTLRQLQTLRGTPILLVAEAGTGKELLVDAIHDASRRPGELAKINCSAESDSSKLELTLFGSDEPGSSSGEPGIFERCNNGTVFLDEIDDLRGPLQVRLERLIDRSVVQRVGSALDHLVNVQLVLATHMNLDELVRAGGFRPELRRMLQSVELRIPPLRERRSDILLLAEHFLRPIQREHDGRPQGLATDATRSLLLYGWPSNVRELKTAIEHAAYTCLNDARSPGSDTLIRARHLPRRLIRNGQHDIEPWISNGPDLHPIVELGHTLAGLCSSVTALSELIQGRASATASGSLDLARTIVSRPSDSGPVDGSTRIHDDGTSKSVTGTSSS